VPAPPPSRRLVAAVVVYVAGLVVLLTAPVGWWLNRLTVRLYTFVRYDLGVTSPDLRPEHYGFALNVLVAVPLGFLLALLLRDRPAWLPAVALLAAFVLMESVQALALPREGSVGDVVANGLGAAVGVACAQPWARAARASSGSGSARSGHADEGYP
jgi:glycopeptide antibiotics resistance protein